MADPVCYFCGRVWTGEPEVRFLEPPTPVGSEHPVSTPIVRAMPERFHRVGIDEGRVVDVCGPCARNVLGIRDGGKGA